MELKPYKRYKSILTNGTDSIDIVCGRYGCGITPPKGGAVTILNGGYLLNGEFAWIQVVEDDVMMDKITNPVKAIKAKCLDCCCWQKKEVELCPTKQCPIWPFRLGKNPYRTKRSASSSAAENLKLARETKQREDIGDS